MWFVAKIILSGVVIAAASWLAGRRPVLAGFLIALPIMSMLSILFSYLEFKDMEKINQFAVSILAAVPLSLFFFVPFLLNRWLKLGFAATYFLAISCVAAAYFIHAVLFKALLK